MTLVRFSFFFFSLCLYGARVCSSFYFFYIFCMFLLSRDNEFVRDTGTQFSCSLCLYGECVARACVQCERTSVHRLSQWVWLASAWSAVLAASCLVVAARRSVCWWRNARRLLGRRRLCAVADCLERGDGRQCAVVDCLAWNTKTVRCRRLLGTWKTDDSVLSLIGRKTRGLWPGHVVLPLVGIVDDKRIVASLQSGKRCVLCVCRCSVVSRLWQAVDDELTQ